MRVTIVAAIAALAAASPAPAQFFPDFRADSRAERDLDWQIDDVYRRIEDARRTGRLTEREARDYHRIGQRIFDRFSYARRDGIDRWEFREISREADRLMRRLERRLRYDDRSAAGRPPGADRRDDTSWGKAEEDWRSDDIWSDRDFEDREPDRRDSEGWPPADRRSGTYEDDGFADDRDDPGDDDTASEPQDDWWLPPEERETIEPRPGDRPD